MARQLPVLDPDSGAEARGLRPGEWVEVRPLEEILRTLDRRGRLDGMPFMPEMAGFCGGRFRVQARAEKTCDTVLEGMGRRAVNTVHLEGVRCDGSHHGGCQALCLVWWREAWLRRVDGPGGKYEPPRITSRPPEPPLPPVNVVPGTDPLTAEDLRRLTTLKGMVSGTIYSCQVTRLLEFTFGVRWFDPRGVIREVRTGNVPPGTVARVVGRAAMNILRRRTGRPPVPHVQGRCEGRTPSGRIDGLAPGDWVEVRSKEEIEATLDAECRNRGLKFDVEMLPYCGRRMRLLQKAERIIDDRTGAMRELPNDCWIIEGAECRGHDSRYRLFCTRRIYPFWREIWLKRADPPDAFAATDAEDAGASAEEPQAGSVEPLREAGG